MLFILFIASIVFKIIIYTINIFIIKFFYM